MLACSRPSSSVGSRPIRRRRCRGCWHPQHDPVASRAFVASAGVAAAAEARLLQVTGRAGTSIRCHRLGVSQTQTVPPRPGLRPIRVIHSETGSPPNAGRSGGLTDRAQHRAVASPEGRPRRRAASTREADKRECSRKTDQSGPVAPQRRIGQTKREQSGVNGEEPCIEVLPVEEEFVTHLEGPHLRGGMRECSSTCVVQNRGRLTYASPTPLPSSPR